MTDECAQRLAVRLAGEVDHDVLEVLTQGTEQHVQLGRTGVLQWVIVVAVGQNPQTTGGFGKRAVNQGAVQAAQMTQGITKKERALKAQQRQAIPAGHPKVEKQGFVFMFLHHQPQVAGEQRTVGVALCTEQYA